MKKLQRILISAVAISIAPMVLALPIEVLVNDTPEQDVLRGGIHELGIGFPLDELIAAVEIPWMGHVPCPTDYTGGPLVQIAIANLSGRDWSGLVYVADPETTLSNFDGFIADALAPSVWTHAFNIDNKEANTPLVFESGNQDGIFEAGEIWEFVIQEYSSSLGLAPDLIDSFRVAGASGGGPPSSGSIIAIPEPSSVILIVFGGMILVKSRRKLRS